MSPTSSGRVAGGTTPSSNAALARLTFREREILVLLGCGLTNAEISEQLVISITTTKTHVARVLGKLELRDRVDAAIYAHRNGLAG